MGTLVSVHCHVNGTLFKSRERGSKVTNTHMGAQHTSQTPSEVLLLVLADAEGWGEGRYGRTRRGI